MTLADTLTLISIIVPILVPLGMALYHRLLEGLPSNRQAVVAQIVDRAVTAVEQMVGSGNGALKKDRATEMIGEMLNTEGKLFGRRIPVTSTQISALIECSVAALNAAEDAKPKPIGFGSTSAPTPEAAIAPTGNDDPGTIAVPAAVPAPAGFVGLVAPRVATRA